MECVKSKSVGYVGARRTVEKNLERVHTCSFVKGCVISSYKKVGEGVAASECIIRCKLEYLVATLG